MRKKRKTKGSPSGDGPKSTTSRHHVVSSEAEATDTVTTRERIIEAAKQHFSEVGLQQASVRAITEIAKVNSALIRYHFGSKQALYEEVVRRIARRLIVMRVEALGKLREAYAARPVPIEQLLRSYVEPLLLNQPEDVARDAAIYLRFFGRMYTEPSDELRAIMQSQFTALQNEYIDEIARAVPHVTRDELIYRFGLLIGAIAFAGSRLGIMEILSDGRVNDSNPAESVLLFVTAYAALFSAPPTAIRAPDARSRLPRNL